MLNKLISFFPQITLLLSAPQLHAPLSRSLVLCPGRPDPHPLASPTGPALEPTPPALEPALPASLLTSTRARSSSSHTIPHILVFAPYTSTRRTPVRAVHQYARSLPTPYDPTRTIPHARSHTSTRAHSPHHARVPRVLHRSHTPPAPSYLLLPYARRHTHTLRSLAPPLSCTLRDNPSLPHTRALQHSRLPYATLAHTRSLLTAALRSP